MNRPELTIKSILLGIILSVVLCSANAYLGLFAGMTVSASIPAAVISMAIFRAFKNSNIFENNIVQTAASAGESLAAGAIFTLPALILIGYWDSFNFWEVFVITSIGGLIGVLFTIPIRRAFIVKEKLQFPEGVATAKILQTGTDTSKSGKNKITMLAHAITLGAFIKLFQSGFKILRSSAEYTSVVGNSIYRVGIDLSPALFSVGYIVGLNIAALVFLGGAISWLIGIPYLSDNLISNGAKVDNPTEFAFLIWDKKIRYLGVGSMVIGGLWSIIKLAKPLLSSIVSRDTKTQGDSSRDIQNPIVYSLLAILTGLMMLFYYTYLNNISYTFVITVLMIVFGFLFSSVAGYMAGTVGSSNNPISGITIATILFTSFIVLYTFDVIPEKGAIISIIIGSVVCCAAAIGGDNLQDLKSGHIIGATPWKQQVAQMIGVLSASLVIGATMNFLHAAYTLGSEDFPAPQATLMKSVADGVFNNNLPWDMIIAGIILGAVIIIIDQIQERRESSVRFPVLAVSVGIYLPIELSTPILIGGIARYFHTRYLNSKTDEGTLIASGLITGEALTGIGVAIPIVLSSNPSWWNFSSISTYSPIALITVALASYGLFLSIRGR